MGRVGVAVVWKRGMVMGRKEGYSGNVLHQCDRNMHARASQRRACMRTNHLSMLAPHRGEHAVVWGIEEVDCVPRTLSLLLTKVKSEHAVNKNSKQSIFVFRPPVITTLSGSWRRLNVSALNNNPNKVILFLETNFSGWSNVSLVKTQKQTRSTNIQHQHTAFMEKEHLSRNTA